MSNELTTMQWRFVIEYCKLLSEDVDKPNATQCALNAGCTEISAGPTSSKWLGMPKIKNAIDQRKAEIAASAAVTTEFVLHQWYQIATADPNDLTQLRRDNCRHCWGYDHNYQWTEGEYERSLNRAIDAGKPAPDGMGGFNFDVNREPCPTCPECGGHGIESVYLADTRKLKGPAKKLFAGLQQTQKGLKVMMRDQDGALQNLARYLGMLVDKQEIVGFGEARGALSEASDEALLEIIRNAGQSNTEQSTTRH